MTLFYFLLILLSLPLQASEQADTRAFQQGQTYAQDLINQTNPVTLAQTPQYHQFPEQGPTQGFTFDPHAPQDLPEGAQVAHEWVRETALSRPTITIDEATDPLVTQGDAVVADPLRAISTDAQIVEEGGQETQSSRQVCYETQRVQLHTCHRTLSVAVTITPERRESRWECGGHKRKRFGKKKRNKIVHAKNDTDCDNKANSHTVVVQPRQVHSYDTWANNCQNLEETLDGEICSYVSRRCVEPHQTRSISGETITRPCWREEMTYACGVRQDHGCEALRRRGCVQIASTCREHDQQGVCSRWKQVYECLARGDRPGMATSRGNTPFCLAGDCVARSYADNDELGEAISKLSILSEIQKDIQAGLQRLFEGVVRRCSKAWTNFKDCCFAVGGWGIHLHIDQCSQEERELAHQRSKNLCHHIGTYCDQRVMGQCMIRKTSFCCFKSKLARILNEQGRIQLGRGWGSPENPDCAGLTIEEITQLNWEEIDLSELFSEILSRVQTPNQQEMSNRVHDRLGTVQTSLEDTQNSYNTLRRGGN